MKKYKHLLIAMHIMLTVSATAQTQTLKDAYKDAFLIGTAVTPAITSGSDKATQDIVAKQFNAITVENACSSGEGGIRTLGTV